MCFFFKHIKEKIVKYIVKQFKNYSSHIYKNFFVGDFLLTSPRFLYGCCESLEYFFRIGCADFGLSDKFKKLRRSDLYNFSGLCQTLGFGLRRGQSIRCSPASLLQFPPLSELMLKGPCAVRRPTRILISLLKLQKWSKDKIYKK